jgi:hypothetical protein
LRPEDRVASAELLRMTSTISLGGHGRVVTPGVLCNRGLESNHNVLRIEDLVVHNDSNTGRLVAGEWHTDPERHAICVPGSPSFARGLALVGERVLVVGSQAPAAIHAIDLAAERGGVLGAAGRSPQRDRLCDLAHPCVFDDPPAKIDF